MERIEEIENEMFSELKEYVPKILYPTTKK